MGNVEIPNWLKGLPLAPVYRPTDTEFADPIAYISQIEKEASAFGICKIIPPLPKPSKKYVFQNLNKSLLRCPDLGSDVDLSKKTGGGDDGGDDGEVRAVFTTRQQELGQSAKRARGTDGNSNTQSSFHKQVWQSGEIYTLEQFESKSKAFSRSLLGMIKEVSPLVVEALFWKAASEKPIYIEYANDVPGSGFAEPGGHFRHIHRRRRKRGYYRRRRENFDSERNEMADTGTANNGHETKDLPTRNGLSTSLVAPKPSTASSTLPVDGGSQSSRKKIVNSTNDMEGTAGWKLSNSPWNLQMIARSPGSLTRFVPDDIPGVTSPMVYIGMLFSWFAWHVEDHELHSMNFLHTGSPKTWYSVPGDYAFEFEEVVRTKVYGGNIDQLAALTRLGEKTTLLSPEMVVESGIPCCRLVQNPGEFVVTFPRAYHVGFSHGFNCGEAANFGTPQWLKVAKEAAVRRAAMNYLPMLSHQQLLYLLTMSFVSRVPRFLLPGARTSRLRDRQRERREFLVKKAFIEDMLSENKTLSLLLGGKSTYRTVLWDPDLLPHHSKESQVASVTTVLSAPTGEFHDHSESNNNDKKNTLLEEMSLFMENLDDLYLDEDDDDDLLSNFQVDSGTLPCVACGILGFPFMCVVQPSMTALMDLTEKPVASGISDPSLSAKEMPTETPVKIENGWDTSCRCLRPRIFCLEHTVQVQKLLQSKGRVSVLVICHKDYQKIKAHATAISEDVGLPFSYKDVSLESASQEDLSLIEIALDDEENNECVEDWTSKLGINLRYCVKVRKNSPTKQILHGLSLGGLFSNKNSIPDVSNIKWQLRKSRSKAKLSQSSHCKPCENIEIKVDEGLGAELACTTTSKREEKIIQYSRRKKSKPGCSGKSSSESAFAVKCSDPYDLHGKPSESNIPGDELTRISQTQQENLMLEVTRDTCVAAASAAGSLGLAENQISEALNVEAEPCDLSTGNHPEGNCEIKFTEGTSGDEGIICTGNCPSSSSIEAGGRSDKDGACGLTNRDTQASDAGNSAKTDGCLLSIESHDVEMKDEERSCMATEVHDHMISNNEVGQENPAAPTSNNDEPEPNSSGNSLITQLKPAFIGDSSDGPRESYGEGSTTIANSMSLEKDNQQEISVGTTVNEKLINDVTGDGETSVAKQNSSASNTGLASSYVPIDISVSDGSQIPGEGCSTENLCNNSEVCSLQAKTGSENIELNRDYSKSGMGKGKKGKIEAEIEIENMLESSSTSFIRSPCEGLRPRVRKEATGISSNVHEISKEEKSATNRAKKPSNVSSYHRCGLERCKMSFETKEELRMHKRNRCTYEGCGKKFRAHKYVVLHQRVHNDDRPFKCPWKGCSMTFKWAWARTEHIRLHTGERPYKCKVEGCGLSFRFVSDFSRHRRKSGHYVNSAA